MALASAPRLQPGYDAAVYRDIAEQGYDALSVSPALRRCPWWGERPRYPHRAGVRLLAAVAYRLALEVTADGDLARRAATLVGLALPAFTLDPLYRGAVHPAVGDPAAACSPAPVGAGRCRRPAAGLHVDLGHPAGRPCGRRGTAVPPG